MTDAPGEIGRRQSFTHTDIIRSLATSLGRFQRGMEAAQLARSDCRHRPAQLASAAEQLEDVLESVDFADEPELADAVLEAVKSTDRAYQLANDR